MAFLSARIRSQGSSPRYRIHESKVAPPHDSIDQKPTSSSKGAIGSISANLNRVANNDWWASRRTTSVMPRGFVGLDIVRFLGVSVTWLIHLQLDDRRNGFLIANVLISYCVFNCSCFCIGLRQRKWQRLSIDHSDCALVPRAGVPLALRQDRESVLLVAQWLFWWQQSANLRMHKRMPYRLALKLQLHKIHLWSLPNPIFLLTNWEQSINRTDPWDQITIDHSLCGVVDSKMIEPSRNPSLVGASSRFKSLQLRSGHLRLSRLSAVEIRHS